MNDAQSTVVGLKAQPCPGGGWTGMPAEIEERGATVAECLADGSCGCIYGDAVQHIEQLTADISMYIGALAGVTSQRNAVSAVNGKLFAALREMSEWWAYAMEKPPGAHPDADDQKKVEELAEQAIEALHAADPSYTQRLAAERAAVSSGQRELDR